MSDQAIIDDTSLPEKVTRRGLVEIFRKKIGAPLTRGKLNKAIREGNGPEIEGRWGNADLIDTVKGLAWARSEAALNRPPRA